MAALTGVLGVAALALCADPAFAQSTSASTSGAGAVSGSNSNADSNASLQNSNANVNSNKSNSNSVSGSSSASKSNANSNQRQGQGQAQSQRASAANNGSTTGSNSMTFTSTTPADQTIKNVPNVYAPGLAAAGSEVCLGSLSAGGAAAGFGVTVGGTMVDQECQLRMNARTLATLGYAAAAREEMCVDPQVRAAMLAAGTPCAADRAPQQARAEYDAPASLAAANVSNVAAAPAPQASAPAPGCRKQYQLLGGWYEVCPPAGQAVYASADNLSAEAAAPAPQDSAPAAASGCRKGYQLIGGWYDDCK